MAIIEAFGTSFSPIAWGYIYRDTVAALPAFTFYCIGGANAAAFLLALCLRAPAAATDDRPARARDGAQEDVDPING